MLVSIIMIQTIVQRMQLEPILGQKADGNLLDAADVLVAFQALAQ